MTEHRPLLDKLDTFLINKICKKRFCFNAILNIIFNFILTFHSNHINIVGN